MIPPCGGSSSSIKPNGESSSSLSIMKPAQHSKAVLAQYDPTGRFIILKESTVNRDDDTFLFQFGSCITNKNGRQKAVQEATV